MRWRDTARLRDTYKSSRLADVVWKAFPIWRRAATCNNTACFSTKRQVRSRVFFLTSYGSYNVVINMCFHGRVNCVVIVAYERAWWLCFNRYAAVRLLASHLGEPGSITGGVAPECLQVGIAPGDATGQRFLPHTHFASPRSALKTSMFRATQALRFISLCYDGVAIRPDVSKFNRDAIVQGCWLKQQESPPSNWEPRNIARGIETIQANGTPLKINIFSPRRRSSMEKQKTDVPTPILGYRNQCNYTPNTCTLKSSLRLARSSLNTPWTTLKQYKTCKESSSESHTARCRVTQATLYGAAADEQKTVARVYTGLWSPACRTTILLILPCSAYATLPSSRVTLNRGGQQFPPLALHPAGVREPPAGRLPRSHGRHFAHPVKMDVQGPHGVTKKKKKSTDFAWPTLPEDCTRAIGITPHERQLQEPPPPTNNQSRKYRPAYDWSCHLLSSGHWIVTPTEDGIQRHDGNTARLARRSDEALEVRVSVARIAPLLLGLGRAGTHSSFLNSLHPHRLSRPRCQETPNLSTKLRYSSGFVVINFRINKLTIGKSSDRILKVLFASDGVQAMPQISLKRHDLGRPAGSIFTPVIASTSMGRPLHGGSIVLLAAGWIQDGREPPLPRTYIELTPASIPLSGGGDFKRAGLACRWSLQPALSHVACQSWLLVTTPHCTRSTGEHVVHSSALSEINNAVGLITLFTHPVSSLASHDGDSGSTGFSRRSPVSPAPSSRRRSIPISSTRIGSQDLDVKSRPNFVAHSRSSVLRFSVIRLPRVPDFGTKRLLLQVSLLASHQDEPDAIPGQVIPGFSHVGIVLDDAAGRRVFSGISRFPHLFILALLHTHLKHSHQLSIPHCKELPKSL
ncbi:hypothetical protein PR048_016772 [Dryococelus australis]|uniref:Uncharacterized protein n=1 Tax=Dryococelus australis TaxID=614101 RepID=A0ABQ9H7L9_9NEOP|nr:hypothetical protein PR048_016772 [Dryococelus australis]